MGIKLTEFNEATQARINADLQKYDPNGNKEIDNDEIALLLSDSGSKNVEELLLKINNENYEINSTSNIFLKQYIEQIAKNQNVKIPDGTNILISSPKQFSKEYKQLLHDVRFDIYKARVADMFKLLEQDKGAVSQRVEQMNISEDDKNKIIKLKTLFDDYYRIQASYNGKTYNLLASDNEEELSEISPEFAKFVVENKDDLKKQTTDFARGEIERVELSEAGKSSRIMSYVVVGVIAACFGLKFHSAKLIKNEKLADMTKYIAEQREIYAKGDPLLNLPKNLFNKVRNFKLADLKPQSKSIGNPITSLKNSVTKIKGMKKAALFGILATTLGGSADDLCGAVKDYAQDSNNFGSATALGIAIPSAVMGVATSAAIAPLIEDMISHHRATKELEKIGELPKFSNIKNLKKMGKVGILAGAGIFAARSIFGMAAAVSTSGSSWTSMAGTRFLFGRNGNKLEKQNIIDAEDNTSKAATENMMSYEAYDGKWTGITKTNLSIGAVMGPLGVLTNSNPVIQAATFNSMGCSETLTACAYQMLGNKNRKDKLTDQKEALLASVQNDTKQENDKELQEI